MSDYVYTIEEREAVNDANAARRLIAYPEWEWFTGQVDDLLSVERDAAAAGAADWDAYQRMLGRIRALEDVVQICSTAIEADPTNDTDEDT